MGTILDGIPARVALLDRDRRHRYVNVDYSLFMGQPAAALLGRTIAEVIGRKAAEVVQDHGDRALAGETVRWEGWVPYADGANPRFVQRVYIPYQSDNGTVDGYLVFARDLTDLKLGERRLSEQLAALQMSQALNAAITASALDCVVVIDEAGCVVEFNPAAERVFGYRRADVLGLAIGDLIVPPHLRGRHTAGFTRYLATGEAHMLGRRMEIEGMRADGAVFPLELAITEVRLPERRLFTAFLRDLTHDKAAAAELQQSRDALHQSEKMAAFGSLLAGVAHELNNPLSIVVGNAMMLQEDAAGLTAVDAPLVVRAGKIHAAAERCARIVRTFLSMARQRPILLRPFDIQPLVMESLELLAYSLRSSGVEVRTNIPGNLPRVVGDPDRLNQVIVNLVVNAHQALLAQPVPRCITIDAWPDLGADASGLTLSIADNGPGVPDGIRGRIFDPFFTTKPIGAGTGIGLAVSRGIVEAHGGRLTLATPDGGGARFEIWLRAAAPGVVDGVPAPQPAAPAPARPQRTALIVDDEPEVMAVLAEMVASLGFNCDTSPGGAEACEMLGRRDYDIILCDMHMPGVDGAAVFTWLQDRKRHLCDRVAFITADALGQATGTFLKRSGRPVLEKPFVPAEIRRVLAALH